MADLQKAIAAATDAVSDLIPANQQFGGPTRALALLTAWIREATAAYERNVEQMTAEDRHAIDVAKRLCTLDHGHEFGPNLDAEGDKPLDQRNCGGRHSSPLERENRGDGAADARDQAGDVRSIRRRDP